MAVLVLLFAWQCIPRFQRPFRPDYQAAATRVTRDDDATPVLVLKEELNGKPLRYLDEIPGSRLHFAESTADFLPKAVALVQEHGAAWVVLWRWDRTGLFRRRLLQHGIDCEARALGGMPPLLLWRATGAKSAPIE